MATQTLPPIQLRSSYPPGQPDMGAAPTQLGSTPQGVAQIMYPGTALGTLFQGPVLSGPTPGVNGAVGSARLDLCLQVDGSMGNFNLPVQFPGGSFLLSIDAITLVDGMNAFISLGTENGQGDIATVPLPAAGAYAPTVPPAVQLPLWDAAAPQEPFTMWLNVSTNAAQTAGIALVIVNYIRIPAPWSEPATNFNRP